MPPKIDYNLVQHPQFQSQSQSESAGIQDETNKKLQLLLSQVEKLQTQMKPVETMSPVAVKPYSARSTVSKETNRDDVSSPNNRAQNSYRRMPENMLLENLT